MVDERQKSQIEKRKRNLNPLSPVSRREREIRKNILNFQKKEREIFNAFLQCREEKENIEILFFNFESRKRKVK